MQVTEVLQLANWFYEHIVEEDLADEYLAFYNKLNLNTRQNQAKQSFEDEKEILFTTLNSINFQDLSLEQIKFLEELEVAELIGEKGIEKINEVLFDVGKNAPPITRSIEIRTLPPSVI